MAVTKYSEKCKELTALLSQISQAHGLKDRPIDAAIFELGWLIGVSANERYNVRYDDIISQLQTDLRFLAANPPTAAVAGLTAKSLAKCEAGKVYDGTGNC
jgi:hypothetical protein